MSRLPQIANPHRRAYPSDLSDAEWEIIEPLLPAAKGYGHPRTVDLREIRLGHFLGALQWLPVGDDAPRAATWHGVQILPEMGTQRYLETDSRSVAAEGENPNGAN